MLNALYDFTYQRNRMRHFLALPVCNCLLAQRLQPGGRTKQTRTYCGDRPYFFTGERGVMSGRDSKVSIEAQL